MSESTDSFPQLDETIEATARYLAAIGSLSDDDMKAPSLLPGWTRAHVITHVARNADALANVLHGAQHDEVRAMYPSDEERDRAVDEGARGSAAELVEDSAAAAKRWEQAANELHVTKMENQGARRPGEPPTIPARKVGILRRVEVEVHHADLDIGYGPDDWPPDFVRYLMKRRQRELSADGPAFTWTAADLGESWSSGQEPEVRGSAADLVWWLLGRGSGDSLSSSTGSLPTLGRWA